MLLVAVGSSSGGDFGPGYRIGATRPNFSPVTAAKASRVPLDDGLVWAALHQDAIVAQLPARNGPLADDPAAALLRRGRAP